MLKILRPLGNVCCRRVAGSQATYKTWDVSDEAIYTEEHAQIQKTLQKIIDKNINPFVDFWEEKKDFPIHDVFKKLGDAGLLGVNKPTEYGGLGLDYSFAVAVAEGLGNIKCGALPMAIGVQTDMATPALAKFGCNELREKFLKPTIKGDMVACLGVTETGSGSDVASIKTRAVPDGDDLVINGEKMWITNSDHADWMCMLANTNDSKPHTNSRVISHLTRKDEIPIVFEDVRVPRWYIIGDEGAGFMYQMIQFQEERMFTTAIALNMLQQALDSTIEYTRDRKIFGGSVLDNQVVHFKLAEMQTEIETLRSVLYRATGLYTKGKDVTPLASMMKLKAGRISRELTDNCLQYWGGMGYAMDSLVTRFYRDSRLGSIGGGADEVMLSVLCKYMGILPKLQKK